MSVALSVSNPTSYLICTGMKTVENRSWTTNYRGRIYIHSSGEYDYSTLNDYEYPRKFESLQEDFYDYIETLLDKEQEYNKKIIANGYVTPDELEDIDNIMWYRLCSRLDGLENKYNEVLEFEKAFNLHADAMQKFYGIDVYKNDDSEEYMQKCKIAIKKHGDSMKCFAIIGYVDLVDIVTNSKSVWAEKGMYNWILKNPVLLQKPIINVKGKLRLFDVSHII